MPTKMRLVRYHFTDKATLSRVYLDYGAGAGWEFFGYVVEDTDRGLDQTMPLADIAKLKVKGATAIPAGLYRMVLEHSGKYGPETLTVANVPGYKYIRIHAGNSADDSEGCLIPGLTVSETACRVGRSKAASDWLHKHFRPQLRQAGSTDLMIEREPFAWEAFTVSKA